MWAKSDKDYVLNCMDQVHIFSVFLNVPEVEINKCITLRGYKISNPLRFDANPSVGFKWYGNKLIMRDFADYRYRGDVFEIVAIILKKNCNNNRDFVDIINAIKDHASDKLNDVSFVHKQYQNQNKIIDNSFITITTINRDPSYFDYKFYMQFGITKEIFDANIKVVDKFFIDGVANPYYYTRHDPCYQYQVQTNAIKLYFPLRNKKISNRFITNNRCPLEQIQTIAMTKFKLIVKSQKDRLLMLRILGDLDITDVGVYVIASETSKLPNDIVNVLKSTSDKVFVMFDTDTTGIKSAIEYKRDYGFKPIFITKGYPAKDPTDLVKITNYNFVVQRFLQIYKTEMLYG